MFSYFSTDIEVPKYLNSGTQTRANYIGIIYTLDERICKVHVLVMKRPPHFKC